MRTAAVSVRARPCAPVSLALPILLLLGCGPRPVGNFLGSVPPRAAAPSGLAAPLAASENIRASELQRGAHSSVSLIQVRDREQPHVHARYDLTVTIVRGHGTLWLNGVALPMRTGDVAFIPRHAPHHFVNESDAPAAAIVVFAPPFDGPDQRPVP